MNRYQVHRRFILLDTVTGYRSQYQKESFLIECVERSIDPRPECNWYSLSTSFHQDSLLNQIIDVNEGRWLARSCRFLPISRLWSLPSNPSHKAVHDLNFWRSFIATSRCSCQNMDFFTTRLTMSTLSTHCIRIPEGTTSSYRVISTSPIVVFVHRSSRSYSRKNF